MSVTKHYIPHVQSQKYKDHFYNSDIPKHLTAAELMESLSLTLCTKYEFHRFLQLLNICSLYIISYSLFSLGDKMMK